MLFSYLQQFINFQILDCFSGLKKRLDKQWGSSKSSNRMHASHSQMDSYALCHSFVVCLPAMLAIQMLFEGVNRKTLDYRNVTCIAWSRKSVDS
ncbi:hypothetical protein QVD17_35646 [Tagetes erecta]|uniref:Uncharacterized protein n=1 Tax=Tagetes erecta TaxID=13708 RepID=A0AAD8JUU0_TARER|nr:hypothetical protein QVD17_35646 [Tagetes erecta]